LTDINATAVVATASAMRFILSPPGLFLKSGIYALVTDGAYTGMALRQATRVERSR